jgi:ribosomal protein S14
MATENEIKCLETREQKYKRCRWKDMYISREVILSEAFKQLSATAIRVYLIFLTKRIMKPFQGSKQKRSGKGKYYCENDGQIQFTYREAKERYGISRSAFRSAIDQLIAVGLIDITQRGSGLHRDVTLYGLSERWILYGTPEFVVKKRLKRKLAYGFTKGNTYWKKKIST